jgi:hypothetical protein
MKNLIDYYNANIHFNGGEELDWIHVNAGMFNRFCAIELPRLRIRYAYNSFLNASAPPVVVHTPGPIGAGLSPAARLHQEFRKGIKKDPLAFPELKDESKYVRWSEQMLSTARNQEVDNILDLRPTYGPPPPGTDEYLYYQDKNKYIFSVLDTSVKMRKGLEMVVRDFATTTDGHETWVALHAHYMNSLQAQHRLAALHTKILTSIRLTVKYPDTYCVFLMKFDRMLKNHAAMCPRGGGFTDHLKCTYLQNAIMCIPSLASIFSEQQSYDDIISALSTAIPGFVLPGPTYDRLFQPRAYVQATICDQTRSDNWLFLGAFGDLLWQ